MKVKELIELLAKEHPDAEVIVADNGSMLKTGSVALTVDYNLTMTKIQVNSLS